MVSATVFEHVLSSLRCERGIIVYAVSGRVHGDGEDQPKPAPRDDYISNYKVCTVVGISRPIRSGRASISHRRQDEIVSTKYAVLWYSGEKAPRERSEPSRRASTAGFKARHGAREGWLWRAGRGAAGRDWR